jgi:methylmalonyl-CoA/ethylmalonyl-CoA epimerase
MKPEIWRHMGTAFRDSNPENSTHPFELKFHHEGISVPDLEASISWYKAMLGFELERRDALPHAQAKVAFLRRGDLRIELFEVAGAAALPEDRRIPDQDLRTAINISLSQ